MSDVTVPFFKKKGRGRPTAARQRTPSPPPSALTFAAPSSSKSEVVLPSRKAVGNLLSAGTKRTATQRDTDANADDAEGATHDADPDVKWTAAGSHQGAALEILAGDEAAEILAKRMKKNPDEDDDDADLPDDGMYRGQKAYKSHLKKSKEIPKAMRVGPQRNTSTIKTVTMIDYQPDVCKDYKETGYCGFGDTCKFLHDRGTYLQGWQLDKLAADPKRDAGDVSDDSDSDDEDIPFACLICRKHYTDPIVTRCGHYFCSACAIKRFAKTPKCAACLAPTGGIFNRADKVIEKMNKKRAEKESKEEKDGEAQGVEIEGLGQSNQPESQSEEDSDEED